MHLESTKQRVTTTYWFNLEKFLNNLQHKIIQSCCYFYTWIPLHQMNYFEAKNFTAITVGSTWWKIIETLKVLGQSIRKRDYFSVVTSHSSVWVFKTLLLFCHRSNPLGIRIPHTFDIGLLFCSSIKDTLKKNYSCFQIEDLHQKGKTPPTEVSLSERFLFP